MIRMDDLPIWFNMTAAVSIAVVVFVGNNSTHLEKASMITKYILVTMGVFGYA